MKIDNNIYEKKALTLTILLFTSLVVLLLALPTIQQEVFGTSSEDSESEEVEEEEVDEEEVEEVDEEEVEEVDEEEVEEKESNESDYTNIAKEEDYEEEIDETREINENEDDGSTEAYTPEPFKIYERNEVQPSQTINSPSFEIKKIEDKVIEKEEEDSIEAYTPEPFKIYEKPNTKDLQSTTNSPTFTINRFEDTKSTEAFIPKPFSPFDNYKEFKPLKLPSQIIENNVESKSKTQTFGLFGGGGDLGKAWKKVEKSQVGKVGGDVLETVTGGRGINDLKNSKGSQIVTEGLSCGIAGCNTPATMSGGSAVKSGQAAGEVVVRTVPDVVNTVNEVERLGEQVGKKATEVTENVKDEYKRAEENVKDEAKRAEENVKDEYKRAEENVKEEAQRTVDNIQDQFDQLFRFNIPIPFTIPGTALTGTVVLTGDYRYLHNTDFEITVAGFKPTDFPQIGSDYIIEQHFEATIEDIIRDLSGGTITQIDEGKQFISETLGIQIGPLATFKMDLAIKIPLPSSVSDLTSLKNLLNSINPVPSVVLEGCYNKISNNLPDVEQVSDVESGIEVANEVADVIEDPNKAINQEEVCTTLLSL